MKQIPPLIGQISEICPGEHVTLYCFEIISYEMDSEKILEVYAEAKADKGRSFARMNNASETLYVGIVAQSFQTHPRAFGIRISAHLRDSLGVGGRIFESRSCEEWRV